MRNKLVIWGKNAQEENLLIALELLAEQNKVRLMTFAESIVTEEFSKKLMEDWRFDKEVEFPEGFTSEEKDLSVTEPFLPDDIKVERGDLIQRAQTEWHFVVLSSKLSESYLSELEEIKGRVEKLESFDGDLWDNLKTFWDKVQDQIRDRNLLREHADALRKETNEAFTQLKALRKKLDEDFREISKESMDAFHKILDGVEEQIEKGLRLSAVFNELKDIQRKFRDTNLMREHRSKVWQRLDKAFKTVKEKRFGSAESGGSGRSPMERLERRYSGLLSAIEKMDRSIGRDKDELSFQSKRIANTDGQLEAQIRQAKIKMIEERVDSKKNKLGEMMKTKEELERRMEQQKERDAQRAKQDQIKKAKEEAKDKIADEIKAAAEARVDDEKIEKAAEEIKAQKTPPKKEKKALEEIGEAMEESFEDVVDTIKAIASVVGHEIKEAVEEIKEKLEKEEEE